MGRRKFRLVTWKTGTQVLPNASGTQPFLFIASFYNFASIYFRHFWKALVVGVANWSQQRQDSKQWFATFWNSLYLRQIASAKPWLDVVPLAWCAWWRPKTRRPDHLATGATTHPWIGNATRLTRTKRSSYTKHNVEGIWLMNTNDLYNSWNQLASLTAWWMFCGKSLEMETYWNECNKNLDMQSCRCFSGGWKRTIPLY